MGQGDGSLGGVPDLRREEYKGHDEILFLRRREVGGEKGSRAMNSAHGHARAKEGKASGLYRSTTSPGGPSSFFDLAS